MEIQNLGWIMLPQNENLLRSMTQQQNEYLTRSEMIERYKALSRKKVYTPLTEIPF